MPTDAGAIPFVQAAHFTRVPASSPRRIELLVVHTMEMAQRPDTAEACAHYFATTTQQASAHYCIDNDSVIQCVLDKDVAYGAPPCNHNGLHFELAGHAAQNSQDWSTPYSTAMLATLARLIREKAAEYNIPLEFVGPAGLRAYQRGVTTHKAITDAFHQSTHQDPGPWFPMGALLTAARQGAVANTNGDDTMPLTDADVMKVAGAVATALSPTFADINKALFLINTHLQHLDPPKKGADTTAPIGA